MQAEPERLAPRALALVEDSANQLFLSAASAWEISIKYALGKLPLPVPPAEYVPSRMARSATQSLAIGTEHALHVATLPPHHRDPFDRMLVAQAQMERLPILTADRQLEAYDVEIVWAEK